jgi:hypothetical protein
MYAYIPFSPHDGITTVNVYILYHLLIIMFNLIELLLIYCYYTDCLILCFVFYLYCVFLCTHSSSLASELLSSHVNKQKLN